VGFASQYMAEAEQVHCVSCGEEVRPEAEICPECGVRQDSQVYERNAEVHCRACAETIDANAEICPECGVRQELRDEAPTDQSSDGSTGPDSKREPILAGVLSFVIPGAGQIYNQEFVKAVVIGVLWIASWLTASLLIGFLLGPAMHLIAAVEAYMAAGKINDEMGFE